jgi:hypothetical protein
MQTVVDSLVVALERERAKNVELRARLKAIHRGIHIVNSTIPIDTVKARMAERQKNMLKILRGP